MNTVFISRPSCIPQLSARPLVLWPKLGLETRKQGFSLCEAVDLLAHDVLQETTTGNPPLVCGQVGPNKRHCSFFRIHVAPHLPTKHSADGLTVV